MSQLLIFLECRYVSSLPDQIQNTENSLILRHVVISWPNIIDNICLSIVIEFSVFGRQDTWCFGIKNTAGFVLEKDFFFRWNYLIPSELWNEISFTDTEPKYFQNNAKTFFKCWAFHFVLDKTWFIFPSFPVWPPSWPTWPASLQKRLHSLFEWKYFKTIQWNDSSFQIKHLEFINTYHFTRFSMIHLDV